jgi:hypothetical protein
LWTRPRLQQSRTDKVVAKTWLFGTFRHFHVWACISTTREDIHMQLTSFESLHLHLHNTHMLIMIQSYLMKICILEDDFWRSDSPYSFDCLEYLLHFHPAQLPRVTHLGGLRFPWQRQIFELGVARRMGGGWAWRVGSGLTAQKYLPLVLHGKYCSPHKYYISELAYTCIRRLRVYVLHGAYSCLSGVISSESSTTGLQVWTALTTYTMVLWPKVWYGVDRIWILYSGIQ